MRFCAMPIALDVLARPLPALAAAAEAPDPADRVDGSRRLAPILYPGKVLCAGANYLNQPLLHSIAQSFGISDGTASVLVTCAQVSYALGLLFLVPLGDMLERRRLVVTLMGVAALGLLLSAASPRLSNRARASTPSSKRASRPSSSRRP